MEKLTDLERVEAIIDSVIKVAGGDFSVQIEVTGEYNYLDALAMGINMMIDDLRKKYAIEQENDRIKVLNRELEKAKAKAEESERLKMAFLANMSHEIRTPMNGILGFAELLKDPSLSGEQQYEYIKIIEKSGKRLLNIINDIVNISKIEANMVTANVTVTNINEQIEYIYTFFKQEARNKGIKLSIKNSLPSSEVFILTDSDKLYAILMNLVKNAIKFTKEGSIEFGYNLRTDITPYELEFFVKDTGTGIAKESQKIIFDRFKQAENADRNIVEGTGLGLAISKAYAEMLGGKIWLESEIDKGSTFFFTIPYNVTSEAENLVQNVRPVYEKPKHVKDLKVLIVEDDQLSEELITIMVKSFTNNILIARKGPEAIDICRNNCDLKLILMDIRLPEMNGYEVVGRIREFNKDVIIIAQTAYALANERELAIKAGCDDYITKPFIKEDLIALINKHLKLS
ncbi:MAG: ATP-binding protein [Bacteroidales bacterium]|nr:ATP-binding protein [Bacteroidales bacterium]MDD3990167.1 ATP-binding protein [Bacteroidales bacterium]